MSAAAIAPGAGCTMLLIDADNVSVDVMEQAVELLLARHGALHVRRAYCTAESALKHQAVFKRLGIRPMVNLSTGKNSTDIAMAVDALDLVLSERPQLVAIASSDSDFAPLVARLREKGCRVIGIGQQGKTGDETQTVYDDYTVLAHRKGGAAAKAEAPKAQTTRTTRTARTTRATRTASKTAAKATAKAAAEATTAAQAPSAPSPATAVSAPSAPSAAPASSATSAPPQPPKTADSPAAKPAARKTTRRSKASPATSARATPAKAAPAARKTAAAEPSAADKLRQILDAMPELERGQTVELRVAAERLREAGLLSKSGVSTKVFAAHAGRFELLPAQNPNKVRLRTA